MSYSDNKLSIVVPAYNKGYGLYRFLHALVSELNKFQKDFEVIVVNDGSSDNTDQEIYRYQKDNNLNGNAKKIHYYSYPMNSGKGFALTYGFTKTLGDTVVFIDADLDLHPRQIYYYLKAFVENKSDIVIGSKRHPDSKVYYPRIRKVYSFVYQLMIRVLFRLSVKDTQVGIKVFRREVLAKVIPRLVVKKFAFDLELLVVAYDLGFNKILEVPVDLRHKKFGSTVDFYTVKDIIQDTLAIYYRKNILRYYDRNFEKNKLSHKLVSRLAQNKKFFYTAAQQETPAQP